MTPLCSYRNIYTWLHAHARQESSVQYSLSLCVASPLHASYYTTPVCVCVLPHAYKHGCVQVFFRCRWCYCSRACCLLLLSSESSVNPSARHKYRHHRESCTIKLRGDTDCTVLRNQSCSKHIPESHITSKSVFLNLAQISSLLCAIGVKHHATSKSANNPYIILFFLGKQWYGTIPVHLYVSDVKDVLFCVGGKGISL